MANFVIVIDGEAVGNIPIPEPLNDNSPKSNYFERLIAALSSNPTIIKHETVEYGSVWDGEKFSPPVE